MSLQVLVKHHYFLFFISLISFKKKIRLSVQLPDRSMIVDCVPVCMADVRLRVVDIVQQARLQVLRLKDNRLYKITLLCIMSTKDKLQQWPSHYYNFNRFGQFHFVHSFY